VPPDEAGWQPIVALGVPLAQAREALVAALPTDGAQEPDSDKIPFTPGAKKTMAMAVREALRLGHNYIGTEHILLASLEASVDTAGGVLIGLGVTRERVQPWLSAALERLAEGKRRAAS
jgi:ATP-dependent Clp protease ATP-binding subunit ClpA